ncbi:hypothetical protein EVAR_20122_1 [Eumeta japonica]|uniref:Uncharacterized protein n=1 Tax=Eumeta variegata TaxID=151549 RepID=A0A4C1V2B4_EUMVA|nr:hypothetical protein EVAR_20122_1 [Eumeta japonica]
MSQERCLAKSGRRNNISEYYVSIEVQNFTSDIPTRMQCPTVDCRLGAVMHGSTVLRWCRLNAARSCILILFFTILESVLQQQNHYCSSAVLRPVWMQHKNGPIEPVIYHTLTEYGREVAVFFIIFRLFLLAQRHLTSVPRPLKGSPCLTREPAPGNKSTLPYVERIYERSLADVDAVSAAAGCGRGTNPAQVLDKVYR